ncbi:MAG: [Fe-Fe] hydrogenase large subunit C-terminal domain-containing protein [Sutterella seckii]
MTLASGGAQLFATTGGVMEAALRTMSAITNQDPQPLPPFEDVRGARSIKETTVPLGELGDIRVAVVHECANVAKVIDMVKKGTCPYHFVEVMACPNGCVGGGGTPRGRDIWKNNLGARQSAVYEIDARMPIRASHENPEVIRLYEDFLGAPEATSRTSFCTAPTKTEAGQARSRAPGRSSGSSNSLPIRWAIPAEPQREVCDASEAIRQMS